MLDYKLSINCYWCCFVILFKNIKINFLVRMENYVIIISYIGVCINYIKLVVIFFFSIY